MASGWHTQEPASSDGIPLQKGAKTLLKAYYRDAHLPSPMGGFLEPLRVRQEDDGSGTVLLECSTSSLRFELAVPRAKKAERDEVKAALAAGEPPTCPRHTEPPLRLQRIGGYLVCPRCGVRYGRAS